MRRGARAGISSRRRNEIIDKVSPISSDAIRSRKSSDAANEQISILPLKCPVITHAASTSSRMVGSYFDSRRVREWCREHLGTIEAIAPDNFALASTRMRTHLVQALASAQAVAKQAEAVPISRAR